MRTATNASARRNFRPGQKPRSGMSKRRWPSSAAAGRTKRASPDGIVLVAERQTARTSSERGCARITEHRRAHPDVVRRRGAGRVSEATVPLATGGTEAPSYIYLQVWVERGSGKSYQRNTGTVPLPLRPDTNVGELVRYIRTLATHLRQYERPASGQPPAPADSLERTLPSKQALEAFPARSRANGSARGRHHRVRRAQRVSYAARLRVRLRRRTRQGSVHCLETVQPVHPLLLEGFKSSGRVQDAGDRRRVARLAAPPLLPVRHAQRARTAISGRALEECRALQCRRRYRME